MQQPEDVIAFLLDKGSPEFIKDPAGLGEPYATVIRRLAETQPLERAALFEALCAEMDGHGEPLRQGVYAALEARFARKRPAPEVVETPAALTDTKPPAEPEMLSQALRLEEDGDAELLVTLYQGQMAYDHSQPKDGWHLWNGQYWQQDTTNAVINILRTEIASQYAARATTLIKEGQEEAAKPYLKRAERLHTQRRKEHVLWAAASMPGVALSGDEWDADPWLLGTPNGIIELQTGHFRPGRPSDWIRTVTPTPWEGLDAPAPRWEQFIQEIFDGDQALAEFFHRLTGYGITGLTTEHAFPVLWGAQGRNGKSTVLETLSAVLGPDLTMSVPSDELMHTYKQTAGPQPYIAKLRGKRLVWASETNPDRRLDAETVKLLTGGDKIHAHGKYTNPIEFAPTHLLLLLTNYRPKIEAADNAIWDRVHLIPFNLRFVAEPQKENERPRDQYLARKLLAERSGILAWLVRGCLAWQALGGLYPPKAVQVATSEYRDEEDTVSQFINEYCVLAPDARVGHRELYQEYTKWCKDLRLWASGSRDFGVILRSRFESKRMTVGIIYLGIGMPHHGPVQQLAFADSD